MEKKGGERENTRKSYIPIKFSLKTNLMMDFTLENSLDIELKSHKTK